MTKKVNTELARVRAASKAIKQAQGTALVKATIQPALAGTLADARAIVARELQLMAQDQNKPEYEGLGLQGAKTLQALMSSLAAAETIGKGVEADLDGLSDEELDAELEALQGKGNQ